jgi:large subunit ribosomal protein L10
MTREEKSIAIEDLTAKLAESNVVYIADTSGLDAETTSSLRRACFKAGIKLEVVKNTLLEKAMEASANEYGDLASVLKGNSSIFIADIANAPAKIIKDFRKKSDKPSFKGAYINGEIYIGDTLLDSLASLKSKEEVIGEIIGLLQSPAKRVIAALLNHAENGSTKSESEVVAAAVEVAVAEAPAAVEAPVAEAPAAVEAPVAEEVANATDAGVKADEAEATPEA